MRTCERNRSNCGGWLLAICCLATGCASGWKPEPIARPADLVRYAETGGFSYGQPRGITVAPDGQVLFVRSGPRSRVGDLWALDAQTGSERVLLTAQQVLKGAEETLSDEEKARRERTRTRVGGIASFSLSPSGDSILVPLAGRLFLVGRQDGRVRELLSKASGYPIDPRFSPDGKRIAVIRNADLFVFDVDSGRERRITRREGETVSYGVAEFVAQEEMGRHHGYWWSPDGTTLLVQRTDTRGVERLHIANAARPEAPPRRVAYPRAGTENAKVELLLINVETNRAAPVRWDTDAYEYLAKVVWPQKGPLTLLVQNRLQTETALLTVDPGSGRTTRIHREKDPAWLNLDTSAPLWLADGKTFLWTTERSGKWQIEVRRADGTLARTIYTDPGYAGMLAFSKDGGSVIVRSRRKPTEQHLVSVPLTGASAQVLTQSQGAGLHAGAFGADRWVLISRLKTGKARWTVRSRSSGVGSQLAEIRSVAERAPYTPRVEWAQVGKQHFNAAIIRPRNFEPGEKYPVIMYVYGGPRHTVVRAWPHRYFVPQWFADHGFVVVMADVRGTPYRGRAWERLIAGDVISRPLADQVDALAALLERYPELDRTRVGLYGWSFGGYFTGMAMLTRPEIFRAGVSGAPVTDWHDYDTHYTERYMGLPGKNTDGYRETSLLTHAKKLKRPLLLIHGTIDDNVLLAHTLKFSDALFRAGRPHNVLPLSGFTHMVHGKVPTRALWGRVIQFFQQHLRSRD